MSLGTKKFVVDLGGGNIQRWNGAQLSKERQFPPFEETTSNDKYHNINAS